MQILIFAQKPTNMRTLLIILPYIPYPLDCGGNNVIFSMINQLRKSNKISIALDIRSHGAKAKPQQHKAELVEQLKRFWARRVFRGEFSTKPLLQNTKISSKSFYS